MRFYPLQSIFLAKILGSLSPISKFQKCLQFCTIRAATSVHGRTNVRRNTVDPSWEGEEFHFSCSEAEDSVEIEIKDKFAKSRPTISRNLGRDED